MSRTIESRRLSLRPLGVNALTMLLAGDRVRAGELLGCQMAADLPLDEMPLAMRLAQLQQHPDHEPWLLRAMVERASGRMIGHIGFHTPPRPAYLPAEVADGVELGYSVQPAFRRQGFAREAALALMHWAYANHGQRCFVLSIAPSNVPSTNMAQALGFTQFGSHLDDEDGLEWEYFRRLEEWPAEWLEVSLNC